MEGGLSVVAGLDTKCVPNLEEFLDNARDEQFDFVCVPLVHPRLERDSGGISAAREQPLTRSDYLLDSKQWSSLIVGKVSPWIDLDARAVAARRSCELAFREEVEWAAHLSLPALMMPPPRDMDRCCANYARSLCWATQRLGACNIWVRLPLHREHPPLCPLVDDREKCAVPPPPPPPDSTWNTWNLVRTACEHASNLTLALEMTENLPEESELKRWEGEPVRCLICPTSIFLTNKKGFPTLTKRHQSFIRAMNRFRPQFILSGRPRHPSNYLPYIQYLDHLRSTSPTQSDCEEFERPYYDYLQAPLQPLADNLESQTYETFEKDPVKYSQYQLAIEGALKDGALKKPGWSPVLMVVGAGRGPLVAAALRAARACDVPLKRVYAVEKNSNAVITLRNHVASDPEWSGVTVVSSDMRTWEAPEKADILVSELLGSWGDNELSPECLDGAQKFLAEDGISIPCNYTSYVAPISSQKLWRSVKAMGQRKAMETTYVVKLHNFSQLATEKKCFYFEHPVPNSSVTDNRRYSVLSFAIEQDSLVHGFAGYFESVLYGDVAISIVPYSFSEGMFSWFPLYIPLRHPVLVKAGQTLTSHFWRCCSSDKVWYEWSVTSPIPSPIHNCGGRSQIIGL